MIQELSQFQTSSFMEVLYSRKLFFVNVLNIGRKKYGAL